MAIVCTSCGRMVDRRVQHEKLNHRQFASWTGGSTVQRKSGHIRRRTSITISSGLLLNICLHLDIYDSRDIFMSLLAGDLYGVVRGVILVVFNATAGASSCYFLSKSIGRTLVTRMWPERLSFFRGEIAKRREKLLNYMLFFRITPSLPNLFINSASPIVDIPFHVFFLATLIGLFPASLITVKAGLALGDLKSVRDLYDMKTLFVLFLIGMLIIIPTHVKRKQTIE